jgi:hypothetical protein
MSGEIVQMTMQMNLIFEVQHLTKTYFIQSHIICTFIHSLKLMCFQLGCFQ